MITVIVEAPLACSKDGKYLMVWGYLRNWMPKEVYGVLFI